jgi:hypothetical protein
MTNHPSNLSFETASMLIRRIIYTSCLLLLGHSLAIGQTTAATQPEMSTGFQAKPGWHFKQRGVASAHPLASLAGPGRRRHLMRASGWRWRGPVHAPRRRP